MMWSVKCPKCDAKLMEPQETHDLLRDLDLPYYFSEKRLCTSCMRVWIVDLERYEENVHQRKIYRDNYFELDEEQTAEIFSKKLSLEDQSVSSFIHN